MPSFFIIGASSCGTTSLYHYLKQHPQIYMSPAKEPHYFSFSDKRFSPVKLKSKIYEQSSINSLEEYQKLFMGRTDEVAVGESSASYIYSVDASQRIYELVPNAKIIAILRNPVDRAYSNYLRCVRDGHECILDFTKALSLEPTRIQNNWSPKWFYKSKGFYYEQLKRYFDCFDSKNIFICLYDELNEAPYSLIKKIFDFLQVDNTFKPDISTRKNVSLIPRNQYINDLINQPNSLVETLRLILPWGIYKQLMIMIKNMNSIKPAIQSNERIVLIQEYQEDILKLQNLIQRDLSKWLQF